MRFPHFLVSCLLAVAAIASPVDLNAAKAKEVRSPAAGSYWFQDIQKQGFAAFNPNPNGFKVFRNVKDYGAKGDGVTDDSAAINRAIADQGTCKYWVCQSSTTSPTVIYFPSGTYVIGKAITMHYMTQLHGDAANRPVLKAAATLEALGLIDASPYGENGIPGWISTNTFMRQIRNFVIDLTARPPDKGAQGIHWPASQATTIQNVKILMTESPNSQHCGIFIENGSGGHLVDIETVGGLYGLNVGNQQFTVRNVKVSNAKIGISQIWNWGFLYQGLTISDCGTAFSMVNGAETNTLEVGSVVITDSNINNCPVFVDMAWTTTSNPTGSGSLILENVNLSNVGAAVKGTDGVKLPGGTYKIVAWGQGNQYTPDGPKKFQGTFKPVSRPQSLTDGDRYWTASKPQYERSSLGEFISARSLGCRGDGRTDDTAAFQAAINKSAAEKKILFVDHGQYKVTDTIVVPAGVRMIGEAYPVVLAANERGTWGDWRNPKPVIQIGKAGDSGSIEWSDMVVSSQGATPGAKFIEYNLKTARGSGIWDVHTRIGGAAGTNLQVAQCPIFTQKKECMVGHTNVHITKHATGAYLENNWFWTSDHDLDDVANNSTRISVYAGRGFLIEGSSHTILASGSEHQTIYQYQFSNAKDIFAGFIQSETPYMQPAPDAKDQPYPLDFNTYNDPDYNRICPAGEICSALGLRIVNSQGVHIYGAGHYSFFRNYDVSCSDPKAPGGKRDCQNRIVSLENSSDVVIYALVEVGAMNMVTVDGVDKAKWSDNLGTYSNIVALLQYGI